MSRYFSRLGPWFFILALAWYVAGNFALERLSRNGLEQARTLHKNEQVFDIGTVTSATIHSASPMSSFGQIKVFFDRPHSQAVIINKNLAISVDEQIVDGAVNLTLNTQPEYAPTSLIEIHLPTSVNKMNLINIVALEITGNFTVPTAALSITTPDCLTTLNINHLVINQLELDSVCKPTADKRCCHTTFNLGEGVEINQFSVSMPVGNLHYWASNIPKKSQLNLGDNVDVTGKKAFLQSAVYGNFLQVGQR